MVVRHAKVQRHVGHAVRPADVHLQRYTVPAGPQLRRSGHGLGVPERDGRQEKLRTPPERYVVAGVKPVSVNVAMAVTAVAVVFNRVSKSR